MPAVLPEQCDPDARVYKYPLPFEDMVSVTMPAGADLLGVRNQNECPVLYARVDLKATPAVRVFYLVGTGHALPVRAQIYIDTVAFDSGATVYHVFEDDDPPR